MQLHSIPPVWDKQAKILILGSFPSVKSRESGFFYGHPQNRFWRVLAAVFGKEIPQSIEEKRAFLLAHRIALWDVVAACEISGSADSSIRAVTPNDISMILKHAPIRQIITNGKTADTLYRRYIMPSCGRTAVCLPSTSPANARLRVEDLINAWNILAQATEE